MTLVELAPALFVILLLAGFFVALVWRLYIAGGPSADQSSTAEDQSGP
ncbi:MAG TPA: hypothetical protein VMF90_09055 [Rhizobiaceae bacterium]|nr:hypothetical protein [Rhizobiaceae bacterium]